MEYPFHTKRSGSEGSFVLLRLFPGALPMLHWLMDEQFIYRDELRWRIDSTFEENAVGQPMFRLAKSSPITQFWGGTPFEEYAQFSDEISLAEARAFNLAPSTPIHEAIIVADYAAPVPYEDTYRVPGLEIGTPLPLPPGVVKIPEWALRFRRDPTKLHGDYGGYTFYLPSVYEDWERAI